MNWYQRIFFLIVAFIICNLIHFFPQFVIAIIIVATAIVIFVDWLFDKEMHFTDGQKLKGHGRPNES